MSNTIPLKEKLDFQQYQLVINALTKIGIEIDIPTNVDAYAASLKEKELKETPLKENEQLFKIELPLAEPLFLADKKGGEMIVITKDTYNKLLIRIEELETLNRTLKEKLVERPMASAASVAPAPTQAPTPPPAMAFTSTPVAHIPEPQATPVTQSPMAFTSTPVATPPKESTHTFSTTEPLATSPLVPHTITKTTEEPTYHKEPTPTYQTPMSTSLHQDAANISNEEALERARRIIEKYKK
ncbi:hypothetical protein [uncultured Capnocytophaga sp.]|uniref:hypothetical protein n=1 Tax=uncultured Capnocytophaga sp. TaxID=159273 RepID=UPI0026355F59|nr:hypothetical protein [uncultured Capnocytophaga sp.]